MLAEVGPVNPIEKVAAWNAQSGSKAPDQDRDAKLREIVVVSNNGAWREEIEIEIRLNLNLKSSKTVIDVTSSFWCST